MISPLRQAELFGPNYVCLKEHFVMNSGGFCNQTDRVCDQSATEMWWPPSLPPSVSKFHLEIQLKVEAITLLEKQKKRITKNKY